MSAKPLTKEEERRLRRDANYRERLLIAEIDTLRGTVDSLLAECKAWRGYDDWFKRGKRVDVAQEEGALARRLRAANEGGRRG